jgi:hypothetical protein
LLPEGGRINLTLRRVTRSGCVMSTNQASSAKALSETSHDLH